MYGRVCKPAHDLLKGFLVYSGQCCEHNHLTIVKDEALRILVRTPRSHDFRVKGKWGAFKSKWSKDRVNANSQTVNSKLSADGMHLLVNQSSYFSQKAVRQSGVVVVSDSVHVVLLRWVGGLRLLSYTSKSSTIVQQSII